MFEGIPTFPDPGRYWAICEKYKVTQFYTAPTAIRALMACGDEHVEQHNLESLRVLGSVGEPINEEAWHWYHEKVGNSKCPIVDTWWQTETGGIMISGLGDISPQKPAHAGYPLPGIQAVLLNPEGQVIETNDEEGLLCIDAPWPSMIRTTYGDHERCINTYFRPFPGRYFTGDGAKRDENGLYRVIGRVDDVINVSGHRFGTAEIESAINQTPKVVESAVVGYEHPIKGQGIHAFVICEHLSSTSKLDEMSKNVNAHVELGIGKIARPDRIQFVQGLPKTRSGKIMRRILRKIASGDSEQFGDTSTLLDPCIVDAIVEQAKNINQA
jgi:acetyl-CoA synthetase